jgi:hypothetical protein
MRRRRSGSTVECQPTGNFALPPSLDDALCVPVDDVNDFITSNKDKHNECVLIYSLAAQSTNTWMVP